MAERGKKKTVHSDEVEQFLFFLNDMTTLCKSFKEPVHIIDNKIYFYPKEISEWQFPTIIEIYDKSWKKQVKTTIDMEDFSNVFSILKKKEYKCYIDNVVFKVGYNEVNFHFLRQDGNIDNSIGNYALNEEDYNRTITNINAIEEEIHKLVGIRYEFDERDFARLKNIDFPTIYFMKDKKTIKVLQDHSLSEYENQGQFISRLVFDRKLLLRMTAKDDITAIVYLGETCDYYKITVSNKKYSYTEYIKALHV